MECAYRERIQETFTDVRELSFDEKKHPFNAEERINSFLDRLIEVKKTIKDKTERIKYINDRFEKITWFSDLDEECLRIVNDIISASKDLHSSLVRQYISMDELRTKGIAKDEIKDFKNAIDNLKEAYEDLESVFFFLPEFPDFKETTKRLSLV